MKVVNAAKMREIDRLAVEQYELPEIVLMENAGVKVAQAVQKQFQNLAGKKICIFTGKGNNGGDGFVAARHLSNWGVKVKVFIIAEKDEIIGPARMNLTVLEKMEIDIVIVSSERDWDKVKVALAFSDGCIDALLGTGFKRPLSGSLKKAVEMLNASNKAVIAIDLPSGVEADTGAVEEFAVRAVQTVTFGLLKPGLLFYPGSEFAGEISVENIGLPKSLLEDPRIKQSIITNSMVKGLLPKRAAHVHKGMCGKVLVIAGSRGMTGAAALASNAAMRAGAGLTTLALPESLHDIAEAKLTEVMTVPLPETQRGLITEESLHLLLKLAEQADAVVVGPGLGREQSTRRLIEGLVDACCTQLVLDADALYALSHSPEVLQNAKIMPILTPHVGEMAVLAGKTTAEIESDLIGNARSEAALTRSVVVLKSARTIVAYPDGDVYINIRGNAGMATAGSGDVLAGTIGALAAQGLTADHAAVCGVYLHSMAGDIAASAGMVGLTAQDILRALPAARFGIQE